MTQKDYYQIGEISKLVGLPIKTLRYYDQIGLLSPERTDPDTNYRYYTYSQISIINAISFFKNVGFSLKEIECLLKREDLIYNQQMLQQKSIELEKKIREMTILKTRVDLFLSELQGAIHEIPKTDIVLKEIPESRIAYLRYTGSSMPNEFYVRYSKLTTLIKEHNLQLTGTMMAIYHDDYREFDYNHADIEVCITVSRDTELEDNVVRSFGGFLAIVAYHYGSYSTISQTYGRMLEWADRNHYSFIGGAIENYIIDIVSTKNEDNYVTELILPVIPFG